MFRIASIAAMAAFGAILAGCASESTTSAPTDTELAAYAASHQYPITTPSNELRVAAVISSDRREIKLYNFTNHPHADVEVWVNGSFVQHVRGIPANGSVTVHTSDLYDHFGKSFASRGDPITNVQIHIGDNFYNAMGPVTE